MERTDDVGFFSVAGSQGVESELLAWILHSSWVHSAPDLSLPWMFVLLIIFSLSD